MKIQNTCSQQYSIIYRNIRYLRMCSKHMEVGNDMKEEGLVWALGWRERENWTQSS